MSGAWDRVRAQHGHPLHRDHTEDLETGIAKAVREIDEMRAQLQSIREYAALLRNLAKEHNLSNNPYVGRIYDDTATALERKIGDRT